ncbi:MAG: ATP-dependent DNA helicase RecG [Bacteroidales bacterium]|jgi:ATP-dependent DNA helicase RecG|nr:ATP-dependent DNA helicase RecG [Bacteroidales bacterium]
MHCLLDTSLEFLKGVGTKRAELFKREFNLFTYRDLLYYFPYRHIDRSRINRVSELETEGAFMQFKGKVIDYTNAGHARTKRLVARFSDGTGTIDLVWFNSTRWVEDLLSRQREFIIFGKPTLFNGHWNMSHPEMLDPKSQQNENQGLNHFQPLYNTSDRAKKSGLDSKAVSKIMAELLTQVKGHIEETLSADILQQHHLLSLGDALAQMHYPVSLASLQQATNRMKFEELFFTQLKLLKLKLLNTKKIKGHRFVVVGDYFHAFYRDHLPFELTGAQKRVIKEIRADLGSGHQMNRLLQGDVGSGKTITALLVMLIAKDNGCQSCLMAPTEILANQHFDSISKQLGDMDVKVAFLSGSTKIALRRELQEQLLSGEIDILVGTHAIIEDKVTFKNLGLVVIDEQHRFGVEQRAKMWKKNTIPPHVLVMTATPIPRTLAMTLYGDLDLSVINELPKGRKPVQTVHWFESQRLRLFGVMKREIELGRQIFVVYPLIEESENVDMLALMAGYDNMSNEFPLPRYAISMVHGKMKSEDKEFEMQRFVKGETNILLSTTVIEVGIDVPNATVMVIENAERFGLSQLHQLRGRVGRGGEQSYCILMTGNKLSQEGRARMNAMVGTNDGFEIANVDLKLRGPGDIQGTRQSGMLDFKVADLVKDEALVVYTRTLAQKVLEEDPDLQMEKNRCLAMQLQKLMSKGGFWSMIS